MHNYRGKRLKTHKKNYQVGGIIGTPEQRAKANAEAQRLAGKYNLIDAPNMQIGEYLPEYVDPSGRPYQGTAQRQLPNRVPANINIGDIQSEQGLFWYIDPQTGDPVDIDPTAVRNLQFRASKNKQQTDLAERTVAMNTRNMGIAFKYGGRKQMGGLNNIRPSVNIEESVKEFYKANPQTDEQLNPIEEGIRKGIIQQPEGYASARDWYSQLNTPSIANQGTINKDWMRSAGIGLMGARGVLSELSGRVARSRQDRYDMLQQRLFNEKGSVNLNDYQPSPYSLYAKYGGKLRDFMPKFNNKAEMRMDAQYGGYMKHGGNPEMAPYHNLSEEDYNMMMQQMQVPEGFHLMPDGTLMADNKMYRGGGLSREKNYGSKKKPYPSVKSSDFAGGNRSYPIPTKADAIDALRLAGLHGRSDVRAKVYKKYPELRK